MQKEKGEANRAAGGGGRKKMKESVLPLESWKS